MLQQNGSYIEGAGGTLEIVAARKKSCPISLGKTSSHILQYYGYRKIPHYFFNIANQADLIFTF
jgi:hypothetical protein